MDKVLIAANLIGLLGLQFQTDELQIGACSTKKQLKELNKMMTAQNSNLRKITVAGAGIAAVEAVGIVAVAIKAGKSCKCNKEEKKED